MTLPVAILAGGLATRLRPVTEKIPKVLLAVNGEPFVYHQLRLLRHNGVERVVFCVGYLGEQVVEIVGDGSRFDLHVEYSFDGPRLLGTGGAVRRALSKLGDDFFVLYGDSYLECDYTRVENAFSESNHPALMTVFHNNGGWDVSNVEFNDGKILAYSKVNPNPRMTFIDYGLGVFSRKVFEDIEEGKCIDLAEIYEHLVATRSLAAFEVKKRFYEIGSFTGIDELCEHLTGSSF